MSIESSGTSTGSRLTAVIVPSMDRMFAQLVDRLDGITGEEFLWEPVAGMWSVRETHEGVMVDGAGEREIDSPPMTTIGWRLWHITVDCFDDYARRFSGDLTDASASWTLDPAEAVRRLQGAWTRYREIVTSRDFDAKLGSDWEHWADSSVADMAMHASNELVHHSAEVALLRDLYRDTPG